VLYSEDKEGSEDVKDDAKRADSGKYAAKDYKDFPASRNRRHALHYEPQLLRVKEFEHMLELCNEPATTEEALLPVS
jgi:hypothetical protein